ncbi:cytochrome P450 2U1 [Elysia marginata]|uniref:Cytochrome P450 2U1 n=1 Tax=Elysia marginata TaxID=1093978 RepID=A0AAV4FE04_9GAST|nr:cytochrome P450 2U1 [Elysia marginata]
MYGDSPVSFLGVLTGILSLGLLLVVARRNKNKRKLPPVPVMTWPLVGNLPSVPLNPRKNLKQWHKEHGDLFSLYFGRTLVVVVCGYNRLKEILVEKGTAYLDRPVMYANEVIGMGHTGLAFSSGPLWHETRSASVSILRELGLGRNVLSEKIHEDIEFLLQRLAEFQGEATNMWHYVHLSTANIICSMVIGKRFNYEDDRFKDVVERIGELSAYANDMAALNYLSALTYLPGDFLKTGRLRRAVEGLKDFAEFCCNNGGRDGVEDTSNENKNFISLFRRKQEEKRVNGIDGLLDDQNLCKTVMDLLGSGTETTSATIAWCVLYLLHHPRVQVKVHEEIDMELGHDRLPCMGDKLRLPYLQAVIKETQRLASVSPFSMMRATSEDVDLGGYLIPKGTTVLPNLDSVMHDPEIWGPDADHFRPERFLNNDTTVMNREEFIPFSMGRRMCPGIGMAQIQVFLFLASMLQRFKFVPPKGEELPTLKEKLGFIAVPTPYKVCCVDRLTRHD